MQFFYILSGEAVMRFPDHEETLLAGDGIEILPNEAHQMSNNSDAEVEFLVVSMPKSHGDRIIVQYGNMYDRVAASNAWPADLHIALHTNGFNGKVAGARVHC